MINLANQQDRLALIQEIEGPENKRRKEISLKQFEIFNDRQHQFVLEHLRAMYSEKTVKEMNVISSVNLARRIVKSESSLYRTSPKREFYEVTEQQEAALKDLYANNGFDDRFCSANEYFKLQNQVHIQWTLKEGKIKPRILLPHHLDVVPKSEDPEEGLIYIISVFDRRDFLRYEETLRSVPYQGIMGDYVNQKIGDPEDYQKNLKKYVVWSPEFNFIMNGDGVIESEEIENPLGGIVPIVEVSTGKDYEYWVRQGQGVTDFSIQFNAMLTDVQNVVRLQGFGQAVIKGPRSMLPEHLVIGPNNVLILPIDENNPVTAEFQYVTPNADIAGSLEWVKAQLAMFLSTRGLDPKSIAAEGASQNFSSAIERMLALMEKFEASKSDMDAFKKAEQKSFEIIKAYVQTYGGTDKLDIGLTDLPDAAFMTAQYHEPQMLQTEQEKLDMIERKIELGLLSQAQAYMDFYGVDEATAVKELAEINGTMRAINSRPPVQETEDDEDESEEMNGEA